MADQERGRNLAGQRFGRLIAVERTEKPGDVSRKSRNAYWRCNCDCGGEKIAAACSLIGGSTKSCGCIARENKQRAGKIRAAQLAEKNVRNFKTPGGDNDIGTSLDGLVKEQKCPACGKIFERLSSGWAYKRTSHAGRMKYYCTWKCFREGQNGKPKPHGNSLAARIAEG